MSLQVFLPRVPVCSHRSDFPLLWESVFGCFLFRSFAQSRSRYCWVIPLISVSKQRRELSDSVLSLFPFFRAQLLLTSLPSCTPVNRGLCKAQQVREIGVVGPIGYLCSHRYSCPPFHSWKCSSITAVVASNFSVPNFMVCLWSIIDFYGREVCYSMIESIAAICLYPAMYVFFISDRLGEMLIAFLQQESFYTLQE